MAKGEIGKFEVVDIDGNVLKPSCVTMDAETEQRLAEIFCRVLYGKEISCVGMEKSLQV